MLLQAFYGIRSERQLMERMEFDFLFRWFVGLGIDDRAWDHSSFSKNRDRLLDGEIVPKFMQAVLAQPKVRRLMSSDHFSVDGTLIEAWASIKSFRRIDGDDNDPEGGGRNAERSFHKEQLPQGEAFQRDAPEHDRSRGAAVQEGGRPARPALLHGPRADGEPLWPGGGRDADPGHRHGRARGDPDAPRPALERRRVTLGADKAYDVAPFIEALRDRAVTPHIAVNGCISKTGHRRRTAIDGRTTRHPGYAVSQRHRKRIEEIFGWIKSSAGFAKVKLRGRRKVEATFSLALTAYNLIRLPRLLAQAPL